MVEDLEVTIVSKFLTPRVLYHDVVYTIVRAEANSNDLMIQFDFARCSINTTGAIIEDSIVLEFQAVAVHSHNNWSLLDGSFKSHSTVLGDTLIARDLADSFTSIVLTNSVV